MTTAAFSLNSAAMPPLSKDSLQEQIFGRVIEMILDGSIVPGEMVTVQSLADAFGVSPMPVRDALRRLTAANALTVVSGRSIGIPALSHARLTDLRNVRFEIEPIAARWAAERCDGATLATLALHLKEMETAIAKDDIKSYLRANYAFHFTIYRASGSENMLKIIEILWLQISPYFNMLRNSGNYSKSNQRHQEMYSAMRDHDCSAIDAAIRADIDTAFQNLSGLFE